EGRAHALLEIEAELVGVERGCRLDVVNEVPDDSHLREALLLELRERLRGLAELEPHSAQDSVALRELHLVVLDDLHGIAPGIMEVQSPTGADLDAGRLERLPRRFLVLDDEPEVAGTIWRPGPTLHEREEL